MAEGAPGVRERPLSPHVQVWRWHVTMAASILHRVAGVALYAGALILAGWALGAGLGTRRLRRIRGVLASNPAGLVVLFGLTVCAVSSTWPTACGICLGFRQGLPAQDADATAWLAFAFAPGATAAVCGFALLATGTL